MEFANSMDKVVKYHPLCHVVQTLFDDLHVIVHQGDEKPDKNGSFLKALDLMIRRGVCNNVSDIAK
jgi:hypothetical protein